MTNTEANMSKPKRKRRGHGEGNIRPHPKRPGLWEARFTLEDGTRRSVYGHSQREAREKMQQAMRDSAAGLDVSRRRETVAAYLDRWLVDVAKPKVRPKTFRFYEQVVRVHLKPGLGRHDLGKLNPSHVQAFLNAKLAAGLSPQTVRHLRTVLRTALNQAVRWYLVPRNVAALTDPPRNDREPVQPLTAAQARAFLTACEGDRLGTLYVVAVATGMRQGELFALRWQDVDLNAGTLHVRHTLHRAKGTWSLGQPKTQKSRRTVYLPASAVAALRAHKDRQLFEREAAGDRWQDHGFVFCSVVGTPLDASNVNARLHKILAGAGLPRQRFHDLRHAAASLMLAGRVDLKTVSDALGHSQIGITANLYAHLAPAVKRDAADALDTILTGTG